MATGDLVRCTVQPSGMTIQIEIEGWATATGLTFNLGGTNATLVVVSEGYDGDTPTLVPRLLRIVPPVVARTPVVTGSNLFVELDLDWPVYDDDKDDGVGTSGYDPTITVASGWVTATMGGVSVSANADSATAANNSELDYPKVIAHWATVPSRRLTGEWDEEVVAFSQHTTGSQPFGISMVSVTVEDANSYAQTLEAIITEVDRDINGFGPAATYRLYRASFDADDRGDSQAFAFGQAVRSFMAYPYLGDEDSIFDSTASGAPLADRSDELWLDPSNTEGSSISAAVTYVDSTWTVAGSSQSGTFQDREFAVAVSGGSRTGTVVKIVDDGTTPSTPTVRFNYLDLERVYAATVTMATGSTSFTPVAGDVIITDHSEPGRFIALVLEATSVSTGVWALTILELDHWDHNTSWEPIHFLRRSAVGADYMRVAQSTFTAGPTLYTGSSLPTGSGTSLVGLASGATLTTLATAGRLGSDTNSGTSTSAPCATIYEAMRKAGLIRSGTSPTVSGTTVRLMPGDHVFGPSTTSALGSSATSGYWATITSVSGGPTARIVGSTSDGIGAHRVKLSQVIVHAHHLGRNSGGYSYPALVSPGSSQVRAIWIDRCVINGHVAIAGVGTTNSEWKAVYTTNTAVESTAAGLGKDLVRDCKMVDSGGDLLSQTQCIINVLAEYCNSSKRTGLHGDVAQWEAPSLHVNNVIFYNVLAHHFKTGQPAPHMTGDSATFENCAFVNVAQQLLAGNEGDDYDHHGSLGEGTYDNILLWNNTTYGIISLGTTEPHEMSNFSVRGCFFQGFERLGSVPVYAGWFHDNFFLNVGGNLLAPGIRAIDGTAANYDDPDDLDAIFTELDTFGPTWWMPYYNGPLHSVMSGSDIAFKWDVYGFENVYGDIGAIVWQDL